MYVRETRLKIGNLVVSVTAEPGIDISGYVDAFVVNAPSEATIRLRSVGDASLVEKRSQLAGGEDEHLTAEDIRWGTFQALDGESIVAYRTGLGLFMQYAQGSICHVVDVWMGCQEVAQVAPAGQPMRELSLVEVLPLPVVVLLAGRQGLFLHSCAVASGGEGILFAGVSGSGKSTMSELWRKFGPSTSAVIDDEHIISHRVGDQMLLYGAPWKRGLREATDGSAPLRAIYFLAHGAANRSVPLSPSDAFAQLTSQVFLPVWSREQVELTLQTCADLVQETPSYRLEFVPGPEVVRYVQEHLEGS
jgi:hypothetical protein